MADKEKPNGDGKPSDQQFAIVPPQLNLPKGGGAIRGMGEKFAANPVTGTGSLTVPIHTSPSRSGFGPQLSLSYDSGAGNEPFGFGWSLALPSITRKTEKGLPLYADATESDIFIFSGAEDMVPALIANGGEWVRDAGARTVYGQQYTIHRYRPRVEGLFARIERWVNSLDPQDTFWRSISKDNVTTWYGKTLQSRIADPSDPRRIFNWLMCESYDDKGNLAVYQYRQENSDGVDSFQISERNRNDLSRSANRYIKHVFYGNRTPYFPDLTAEAPVPLPTDWCFELVFDYGEHDAQAPVPQEIGKQWVCRPDPFSTYRPGFEVRTYRLCRRALMFHHFANEPDVGLNCLVRSTGFAHSQPSLDSTKPSYSFLLSATQTGYKRNGQGYLAKTLPPLEFEYTDAVIDETVRDVDQESLQNLPSGMDGSRYQWVDLDGEGLSGILTEQAGRWFYKPNLSPVNLQAENGSLHTSAQFGALQLVSRKPSFVGLSGRQHLLDLSGDGRLDLVDYTGPTPGFFERTDDQDWLPFAPFTSLPVLDWSNLNLRFIDVTGDGRADLLISEDDAFWWHTSLATEGFGPGQRVQQALDEEKGPKLVFADGTESVFLADLSGDGLTDLVRVRNGEVCYWPNLGYGRFGAKVTMDQSPWFEAPELFDSRRARLADIDGSGTADIIYFASGGVHLYFNRSGNAWTERRVLSVFPRLESVSSATALDLLGNGTACLLWSSPLPGNARRPMRYIDLMGGQKPHLLVHVNNNLGAETRVRYAPSTKFYVADKLAGTPWLTRVPFPVHVVEQVEKYDYVSRNFFATHYAYHHGFYDGVEREFRGFGRVDQWDTEGFATLAGSGDFPPASNSDQASQSPPTWTKTWFHTGAYFEGARVSKHFEQEYYSEGDASDAIAGLAAPQLEAMLLDDTVLPGAILLPDGTRVSYDLSGEEDREASRALRGSILRQEVYALDDSREADRPYSVSERNYTIEVLQPRGLNQYAAFFAHPRETLDFHYERKLFQVAGNTLASPDAPPQNVKEVADPRVTHAITLAVDPFGNVLQSASVAYGRRYLDPALTLADQASQRATLSTYTENSYTKAVTEADAHRMPLLAEASTYELIQVQPDATQADVTNLFRFGELAAKVQAAGDGKHDLTYENTNAINVNADQPYRRLIERSRTLFRPNDLGASAGGARTLLQLGQMESSALPGESYKLAFTAGLVQQVYQRGQTPLLPNIAAVLGSVAGDGGGYVDLDGDNHWWIPSGRVFYLPAVATSQQEMAEARQHFFLPRRYEDSFGNSSSVDYESPHDLLVVRTVDAVANAVVAANDYRVLAPAMLTDPNGNRGAVSFDALGMVAGAAVMDKTKNLGDSLANFTADLTQQQIDDFHNAGDPHAPAGVLLGSATTRIIYDLQRFVNTRTAAPDDPSKWEPVYAATVARETHASDLAVNQESKLQITISYSDGYGREIQKKAQAEPAADGGPGSRWVATGWTIFNNKGNPVRQYEPFFSQLAKGHQFEFGAQFGVSSVLCYDPVDRVVATIHPNHTYEKVVFDPWHQDKWDVNDTVLQADPTADPDVGDFFKRLPAGSYSPTWHALRSAGGLGPQEQDAATKAEAHAKTPAIEYFDSLGRTFLTVADNAADGKHMTRMEFDIEGNRRSITDPLGRKVAVYDYDMLSNRIHQASMEAGERWTLNSVDGQPVRAWDGRGHNLRMTYDASRRPTGRFVQGTDNVNSDPRTLNAKVLYEKTVYGEGQPNDVALNLRTRVFQHGDAARLVTNLGHNPITNKDEAYDFKGNLLRSRLQFVSDYKALPDWSGAPPAFQPPTFTSSTEFDALNRPTAATTPDGSVFRPTYNEANLLERIDVNLRGAQATTPFVANIDYNAKGQRVLIEYGNNTTTGYTYDPATFRMVRLTSTRRNFPANQQTVQDLSYTYDPAGNITHIQDDADIQNVVFFRNRRVEPSSDYTYDAIYRLIEAAGREHLGQNGGGQALPPAPTSYNDVPRAALLQPSDGNALGTYTEQYQYDAAGNFLQFIHRGSDPANPGWTRSYSYNDASQLEQGGKSNRLTRTVVSGNQPLNEDYGHDLHGNMVRMPQLQNMEWDFKDQLHATQRQAVNASDQDGLQRKGERTYYVYDAAGQRARKVTERPDGSLKNERIYAGDFEIYREYNGVNVTLERETLHVVEEKRRIALVETKTIDVQAPPNSLPSTATRYQFDNHLGSACLELDETAAVISYEEYYPYGSTSYQAGRSQAEAALKRYRYTRKERDDETGLYYHGARYYASWLGTWASADPAGVMDGTNLYVYCAGNPIRFQDPDGRDPQAALYPEWYPDWLPHPSSNPAAEVWGDTIQGIRSAQGWVKDVASAAGAGFQDLAQRQIDQAQNPYQKEAMRITAAVDATIIDAGLQIVGGLLMAGPNALEALDAAGTDIGEGAGMIATARNAEEAALGVGRVAGGVGQAALVTAEVAGMASGAGPSKLKIPKGATVQERNQMIREFGKNFEDKVAQSERSVLGKTADQVSIVPNEAPGVPAKFRVRIDTVTKSRITGKTKLIEAKSTSTAPLTKNQAKGFRLIERHGGTVVGEAGGTHFPAGTKILPTRVGVFRPKNWAAKQLLPTLAAETGTAAQLGRHQRIQEGPHAMH